MVEPVSRMDGGSREARSTEEVLRMIGEANKVLERQDTKEIAQGLMDVVGLYPPIDQKEVARVVGEESVDSRVEYKDMNPRLAGIYLATVWSKEKQIKEGIYHLLPRRKTRRG